MSDPYIGQIIMFGGNYPIQGWAKCDGQLMQISQKNTLFNLIGNAIQFSPETGVVEISTHTGQHGQGRIAVSDRGPGIAAEALEQLFSPYFTTRPTGTGLGLAIVRRIATAHGWEAGYEPRPGGGSIFWLEEVHGQ